MLIRLIGGLGLIPHLLMEPFEKLVVVAVTWEHRRFVVGIPALEQLQNLGHNLWIRSR